MYRSIAVLAPQLPSVSATFVHREVEALRSSGRRVFTHGLRAGDDRSPETAVHWRSTAVLYDGPADLVRDALVQALRRPRRALRTMALAARDAVVGRFERRGQRLRVPLQAAAGLALARRLERQGVRHLHVHFAHAPATVGMYAAAAAGLTFSVVGHARDLLVEAGLQREKLRRASAFTTISRANQDELVARHGAPARAVTLARCGVDLAAFAGRATDRGSRPQIVCVARLVPKKGVDQLVRAFAEARLDADLVVAGDGPERPALAALAAELGVADRVRWLGSVDGRTVRALLRTADVFALPCRWAADGDRDGIPVALMEAMASGVPVVAGRVPGIEELVREDETGLLVDAEDTAALAAALARLATDEETADRLAAGARALVEADYDLHRNARALGALLDTCSA